MFVTMCMQAKQNILEVDLPCRYW